MVKMNQPLRSRTRRFLQTLELPVFARGHTEGGFVNLPSDRIFSPSFTRAVFAGVHHDSEDSALFLTTAIPAL